MITVTPTTDMALVERIFRDPSVWGMVIDDDAPEDWEPPEGPGFDYLLIADDGEPVGVFGLFGGICRELHTAVLPQARGKGTFEAGQLMLAWLWTNTEARKLVTWVPAFNIAAKIAAERGGMAMEGNNTASFPRGGKLFDTYLFGIRKEP